MADHESGEGEEPVRTDFSLISPLSDQLRFERNVRSLVERAAPELARRRRRGRARSASDELERWRRPLLAAAASIAILSTATLATLQPSAAQAATTTTSTVSDSVDVTQLLFQRTSP